jgi:hypothetical protein
MKRLLIIVLALAPLAACSHSGSENAASPAYNSSGTSAQSSPGAAAQPDQSRNATQAPTNLRNSPPATQNGVGDNDASGSMTRGGSR